MCGTEFADVLFDCDPDYIDASVGDAILNFATAALLQDTLQCGGQASEIAEMPARWPEVTLEEAL